MKIRRTTLKTPGHFVGAFDCKFYRHDHVGRWCISTVGEYCPPSSGGRWEPLGYKLNSELAAMPAWYETAVFDLNGKMSRWNEVRVERTMTEADAIAAHEKIVIEQTALAVSAARAKSRVEKSKEAVVPPGARVGVRVRRKSRGNS